MQTLRIRVSDNIYNNLMRLLGKFKKNEIEVITEDEKYLSIQNYLLNEFNQVKEGNATYHSIEDLENNLENIIKKNENKG
ncbi:MAG TPA: hypothetical protein PKK00_00580 [Bacteroidales bacterium]|nr:hypothetical protein [Bacteroidales bacterium]HPS15997.1 hypothetical protein [Bacteroidales bacterium]